jgi:sporulation protein YlmC with PRC-barrel domain
MKISHTLPVVLLASMVGAPDMVLAQQSAPPTPVPPSTAQTTAAEATGYLELDDMDVVTPNGDKIGEVEEVLMDTSGQVVAVAVEVGGFLGIGDNDVIIRLDQLRLQDSQLVTTLTKEQIEALPKWDD